MRCSEPLFLQGCIFSHTHLNGKLGDSASHKDASYGRNVLVVASNSQTYVAFVYDATVSRVETDPTQTGQETFYPSMRSGSRVCVVVPRLDVQVAGHITSRNTPTTGDCNHHMSVILANTLTRLQNVLNGRNYGSHSWDILKRVMKNVG